MTEQNNQKTMELNGVPLYTQKGKPRQRYRGECLLLILGCTLEEFIYFVKLFAPRRGKYLIRRTRDGNIGHWSTVKHKLRDSDVKYHVIGDRLPGVESRWVGTFSWDTTRWAAVDVDCRNDLDDFHRRCEIVEAQLLILGIPRTSLLVLPSPSGGRHYYFFFHRPVYIGLIREMLKYVGLEHRPGSYEIFPSPTVGFRMPFGHVPNNPPKPDDWLEFIRKHKDGSFPRVNEKRCWKRANRYAERNGLAHFGEATLDDVLSTNSMLQRGAHKSSSVAPFQGIPKRKKRDVPLAKPQQRSKVWDGNRQIVTGSSTGQSAKNTADAENLIQRGIQAPGTRVGLTKQAAWHFAFAKRLAREEAEQRLVDLVYETGRTTSADVQADLRNGTRDVEQQTREIVDWVYDKRENSKSSNSASRSALLFAPLEIETLAGMLRGIRNIDLADLGRFVLELHRFSKTHGRLTKAGWESSPSVRGIMRKWKRCSGMRYKPKLDAALSNGLISMTRDKYQTPNGTGRARTYAVLLPACRSEEWALGFDEALDYLIAQLEKCPEKSPPSGDSVESDTYCSLPSGKKSLKGNLQAIGRKSSQAVGVEPGQIESLRKTISVSRKSDSQPRVDPSTRSLDEKPTNAPNPNAPTIHPDQTEACNKNRQVEQPTCNASHGSPIYPAVSSPLSPAGESPPVTRPPGGELPSPPGRPAHPSFGAIRATNPSSGGASNSGPSVVPSLVPPPVDEPSGDQSRSIALRFIEAETQAIKAKAKDPTPDELETLPNHNEISAIELIFDVRQRLAPPVQHSRFDPTEFDDPAEILQILRSLNLAPHDRWRLVADPKRLSPGDSYLRTKLLRTSLPPPEPG